MRPRPFVLLRPASFLIRAQKIAHDVDVLLFNDFFEYLVLDITRQELDALRCGAVELRRWKTLRTLSF
jgi:hypothetical protein